MRYFIPALILLCSSTSSAVADHVNVLHIIADDLRPALGCYGDPIAKTPAIDGLARRGVQFDRAYVQYPICGPSRASFLSGLRPQTTNYFGWEFPPDVVLLPSWLRQHGYFTAQFGKVFHQQHILGRPETSIRILNPPDTWDVSDLCATRDDPCGYGYLYSAALRNVDSRAERHVLARGSLRPAGLRGGWFWQEWAETNLSDEQTSDGLVVRRAAQAMEQAARAGRPFYIAAGLRRPHQVLAAPKKYFDKFPLAAVPFPPDEPSTHLSYVPSLALNYNKDQAGRIYSADDRRRLWRAYYANIAFVDAQIDILLQTLERLDLWQNTVVVFHSDHGWHLGEHGGLGNKDTLFDESTRTPLIIAAPRQAGNGLTCPHPVELVDLFPTLTRLCQLPTPARLDGVSLLSVLSNPRGASPPRLGAISIVKRHVAGNTGRGFSGRPLALEQNVGPPRRVFGRSVRTQRWCYIEWGDGALGSELYDQKNDPRQLKNLIKDTKRQDVRAEMSDLLRKLDPTIDAPAPQTRVLDSRKSK